jgi:hypothetical protein
MMETGKAGSATSHRRQRGHPEDGGASRSSSPLVRELLDRAELVALETARRRGESWTDIATMLHTTRRAAWERWHDIDDDQTNNA